MAHKSKNSYCVIVISNIIFLTTNIITITTLPPHMYPISRIISSLPVAPGVPTSSSADVCVVTPVNSQPNDPPLPLTPPPPNPYSGTMAVLCQVHRGNRGMVLQKPLQRSSDDTQIAIITPPPRSQRGRRREVRKG